MVIRSAIEQLPQRIGIADARWASQDGPPKRAENVAMVPALPFATWCRLAGADGDVDGLVQFAFADNCAVDNGKYSAEVVPIPTTNPAINTCRVLTWSDPGA